MTTAGSGTGFLLSYELEPGDLQEMEAANIVRRRRRTRIMFGMVPLPLFAAAFTAITVALDSPSLVKDSAGAPGWMYVVDTICWSLFVFWASVAWRLSPKRLGRAVWRTSPQLHGRHHDEIDSRGVTCTAPDGTETFTPWASLVRVRETEHAFHLLDDRGALRISLPKRGLDGPSRIPALREFLNRSVGGQSPVATLASEPEP
jgi:hypothetical protein